ncbi:hypothetical protein [Myceligenerans crystallogenes]|uniref:ScoMcrA-like N-terminal head domain-containing protein n=1 Tax=Myceligenerans crystallogenes TaxID=316335 RepID=A0ABN2NAS9_9MICO
MATFAAVTRTHVLAAITEHDDRGAAVFLGAYGFTPTPGITLSHDGRTYDAKAILAVAHRHATGRAALPEELADGKVAVGTLLGRRGFEVSGAAKPAAAGAGSGTTTRRAAKAAAPRPATTRRAAVEEKPEIICPTCFMALPGSGICDTCG